MEWLQPTAAVAVAVEGVVFIGLVVFIEMNSPPESSSLAPRHPALGTENGLMAGPSANLPPVGQTADTAPTDTGTGPAGP